jgi:hypothetical protein
MKYKHLYAAHEIRMWVMTIVSAASAIATISATHPEVMDAIKSKFKKKPKIKIVVVKEDS